MVVLAAMVLDVEEPLETARDQEHRMEEKAGLEQQSIKVILRQSVNVASSSPRIMEPMIDSRL